MQGRGNGQGRQRAGQHIVVPRLPYQARFQDHLDQLFDKQGYPIGLGHHLLDHRRWQGLATREAGDHGLHLGTPQAGEGDLGQVRGADPGGLKLRPTR